MHEEVEAVVFDMDRVLTVDRTWLLMTEALGLDPELHWQIYQKRMKGELDYASAEEQIFALYRSSPKATRGFIESHCASIDPRTDACDLISYLREKGYPLAIVSSSFDLQVKALAENVGIDIWYANARFVFEDSRPDSRFAHFNAHHPSSQLKIEQVKKFCLQVGVAPSRCAYVGDDINDIGAFEFTGRGLAVYCVSDKLRRAAWKECETLSEIMEIL